MSAKITRQLTIMLMNYKEAKTGQILQRESLRLVLWLHGPQLRLLCPCGVATIPFYIFYSMFGFQRIADQVWAAADSRARGS